MIIVMAFMLFCVGSLTLPTINHKVALTALAFIGLATLVYLVSRGKIVRLEAERAEKVPSDDGTLSR